MAGSTILSYNSSTSPTTPAPAPIRVSQESATALRSVPESPEDMLTGGVPKASVFVVSSGQIFFGVPLFPLSMADIIIL